MTTLGAIDVPDWAWERAEVRQALRARDIGAVFRCVQQYAGASQARIAGAVGMTQARVNEIINGRREVSRLDVYERIADGLRLPDDARHLLGLASSREKRTGGAAFDLAAFPEVVRVYAAQGSAAVEIQQQAREAAELDVLAVRGLGLIGLNDSLLRACLPREQGGKGLRVRVALLDPDSDALARRAAEIGESAESLASGVRLAEVRLRELAEAGDVAVWRYRMLPTWRLIRTDGTMFVGAFDAGWEGHESALYKVMETPHGPLFRGFRRMFEAVIDGAERTV
ncbi:helix-turn-helix domain-containing protein [Streptomyces scabiei]|nr:helix-turn-helix transcriptional regulator [Streptomyces scabiei]MDW8804608.1 helix-turn-helix transcriptional regulator [Streptomyces scabiei]MDX2869079.1 helix-turn-helix transcriptional regulator [Streptomyces scabiei]MDX2892025.1 helix-turn-helix transcriptional regulator [Streptomyces scabiei]MDX2900103.1 helix-turn-helix transcriptional regulator [Streptomyces scabiei]MDX3139578.1 helix-turn-helix transcriptional regulator [Streptomyces scabiei]